MSRNRRHGRQDAVQPTEETYLREISEAERVIAAQEKHLADLARKIGEGSAPEAESLGEVVQPAPARVSLNPDEVRKLEAWALKVAQQLLIAKGKQLHSSLHVDYDERSELARLAQSVLQQLYPDCQWRIPYELTPATAPIPTFSYDSLECLLGATLDVWQATRAPADLVQDVLWVAEEVLTGLTYIHASGLMHGGICPRNLFVKRGQIIILDAAGGTRITPAYMSSYLAPGGHRGWTQTDDLYSVGAVLCEMVTGHPPWVGMILDPEGFTALPPSVASFIGRLVGPNPVNWIHTADRALAELRHPLGCNEVGITRREALQHGPIIVRDI